MEIETLYIICVPSMVTEQVLGQPNTSQKAVMDCVLTKLKLKGCLEKTMLMDTIHKIKHFVPVLDFFKNC